MLLEFDPESDFFEAHRSHKQHEREMKQHREKLGQWIVYDKYFKQKTPNFLTWAEKEHIRHLHEQDPEEWSPEQLTASFPADIYTIRKILKAKWYPKNEKRVQKHDETVQRNWNSLKSGQLTDIPPKLYEHVIKFANREIDTAALPKFQPRKRVAGIKTKNDEFLSVITSCKKYESIQPKEDSNQFEVKQENLNQQDEYFDETLLTPPKDKRLNRRMTLDELKKILNTPDEYDSGNDYREVKNPAGTAIVSIPTTEEIISMEKFEPTGVAKVKDQDLMKIMNEPIKEKIKIPKKLWKRGATYKINDCFYDDDGEFLYRVPGMTKVC